MEEVIALIEESQQLVGRMTTGNLAHKKAEVWAKLELAKMVIAEKNETGSRQHSDENKSG